jgi:hypothetical protein
MIELVDTVATIGIDFTNVAAAGPPSDLPSAVPEFVGDILGSIRSFLDGSIENLGKTVRKLTPGGN